MSSPGMSVRFHNLGMGPSDYVNLIPNYFKGYYEGEFEDPNNYETKRLELETNALKERPIEDILLLAEVGRDERPFTTELKNRNYQIIKSKDKDTAVAVNLNKYRFDKDYSIDKSAIVRVQRIADEKVFIFASAHPDGFPFINSRTKEPLGAGDLSEGALNGDNNCKALVDKLKELQADCHRIIVGGDMNAQNDNSHNKENPNKFIYKARDEIFTEKGFEMLSPKGATCKTTNPAFGGHVISNRALDRFYFLKGTALDNTSLISRIWRKFTSFFVSRRVGDLTFHIDESDERDRPGFNHNKNFSDHIPIYLKEGVRHIPSTISKIWERIRRLFGDDSVEN